MGSTIEDARDRPPQDADVDTIRAKFNETVFADGRPLAQIAKETGIANSTLHAWKTSTYKGDNARVAKQVDAWLLTREAQRKMRSAVRAEPLFVMTNTASRIWEVLEFAQAMPAMVMVTGGSGVGKTTAIEAYRQSASQVFIATAEPVHSRSSGFLQVLCDVLETEKGHRSPAMSRAIQRRLRGTKGLVIVDEAQNLPPDVRDQLRTTVFDLAGVGVALVGNDEMNRTFRSERQEPRYAQLCRRIGQRLNRDKPYKSDVDMLLNAWGLTDPEAREVALGIAMKPGANGQMTTTLRMAFAVADARGDEAPTAADITACYRQLGGDA